MSDETKDALLKELNSIGLAMAELERKKKEIEEARVNAQHEKLQEAKRRLSAAQNGHYGTLSDEQADELVKQNAEYMEAAGKPMTFMLPCFRGAIPFFAKNMILVGAKTGDGKSTAVANIVRRVVAEVNPATGKNGRVLVLTNEESAVDFYNRITCLFKGWHYVNHDLFTEEQKKAFGEMLKILRHKVTVIDDNFVQGGGATTTPEGINSIFENLMSQGEHYDVVILDYFQGIVESSKDLSAAPWQAQEKLVAVLEKYRQVYPAPLVVMAQINAPEDPENPGPFQFRLQGRKSICNKATTIIEMIAHRKELMTEFYIHKGRYSASVGESIKTGYKNGLFVKYDDTFKAEVNRNREMREDAQFNKDIGIKVNKTKVEEPANG
ncbi:unnamed protein product [Sphagnum balticum]